MDKLKEALQTVMQAMKEYGQEVHRRQAARRSAKLAIQQLQDFIDTDSDAVGWNPSIRQALMCFLIQKGSHSAEECFRYVKKIGVPRLQQEHVTKQLEWLVENECVDKYSNNNYGVR